MQTLTVEIPDDLARRLEPYRDEVVRILKMGLQAVEASPPAQLETPRERGIRILKEAGLARPLDESIAREYGIDPGRARSKPPKLPGQPLSEIVIEQRGPR